MVETDTASSPIRPTAAADQPYSARQNSPKRAASTNFGWSSGRRRKGRKWI
jgi:hypothetical protein